MNLTEYSTYDGVGLATLVKKGDITAKELAELLLYAVDQVNPHLKAVLETYPARAAALSQDDQPTGPFAGVPFLLKDIGAAEAGQLQELGSLLAKGNRVNEEAFLTTHFKQAGVTILGRTAVPEMALSSSTESLLTGNTHNPWQLGYIAGGSSGGAAASVAAGILPIAHATDGAGSIRIPASACGLVGLKPSRNRVSLGPEMGEMLMGMGVEFVVCRTVRDCATMLDAVSQPGPGDPFVIRQPQRPYRQEVGAPLEPLRIAWTTQCNLPGMQSDPEVISTVERVVNHLAQQGHQVTEAQPQFDYEEYLRAICVGWIYGFDHWLDGIGTKLGRTVNGETLEAITLAMYEQAKRLTVAEVVRAEGVYNTLRRSVGRFFEQYDLLVTPTLTRPPEPLGYFSLNARDVDFLGFFRRCDESASQLPLYNLTGQPAISLPLGHSQRNLPLGVQFVAHFGREDMLIRLASALEEAMPWQDRIPPMHVSIFD